MAARSLTRRGLNTIVLECLRDSRNLRFLDFLLGQIEANLSDGPVFFNVFPDFSISRTNPHILECLTLLLKTSGYEMKPGSKNIAVTYRVCYKIMTTLRPGAKRSATKELTMMFITNPRNNYKTPKPLNWEDVDIPKSWTLAQITEPTEV